MELNGWNVHNDVVIVYCSKDFAFRGSPYKEFHVNATRPELVTQLADLFDTARDIKEHHDAGTLPPRVVCSSESSPRSRSCPVKSPCFARSPVCPNPE